MDKIYVAVKKEFKYSSSDDVKMDGKMEVLGWYESRDFAYDKIEESYLDLIGELDQRCSMFESGKIKVKSYDYENDGIMVMYEFEVLEWKVGKVGRFYVK